MENNPRRLAPKKFFKFFRAFFIFLIILNWVFSGWPGFIRNTKIPNKINIAQAAVAKQSWSTATAGSDWSVPSGVTSVIVKIWGAGGGGGGGGNGGAGGAGGGGGFAQATIDVSAISTLTIMVGDNGVQGLHSAGSAKASGGGGGGGYSAVKNGSTILVQAGAGGGGGGGGDAAGNAGGAGGAGGGANGLDGSQAGASCVAGGGDYGNGGTSSAGGTGGAGCSADTDGETGGTDGSYEGGDAGDGGESAAGGGAGGTNGGGTGGNYDTGGGGGGGGRYGGGGGEAGDTVDGGGGGGGGSDYVSGTNTTETAGSGQTPGNNGDSDRSAYCSTAGNGGNAGGSKASGSAGADGCVVIIYNEPPAFTVAPNESADPINYGQNATFTATANDPENDTWYLAVCKTNSVTPGAGGAAPTCATDQTICVSTATADTSESSCTWTTPPEGSNTWYAFACDSNSTSPGASCSSNSNSNSPITVQSAAVVSVTINPENFDYGKIPNNSASSTLTLWSGAGIIATNGDVVADFYIYGADSTGTGAGWTLSDTTNASNNYMHRFCNDTDNNCLSPPTNYTAMSATPTLLKSGVAQDATVTFQLQILTPQTPTDLSTQSAMVTIQATGP